MMETLKCYKCGMERTFEDTEADRKAAVEAGWRMVPGGNIICPKHAAQRTRRFLKERAKRREQNP